MNEATTITFSQFLVRHSVLNSYYY